MNFERVYEEYKIFAMKQQKKQSFKSLTERFNSHILPYFENMNINNITSIDIINWENEILKYNFSNNYNRNLYYIFSGFLEFCHLKYGFDKSILSDVGCFKKKYEEDKSDFYTLKEFNQFIKSVKHPIYKQFFNLMFYTGTRPGEAMALKFSDLQGDYIVVNKTINSHGTRDISTPKTFSSNRKIRIDNFLKYDLLNLKKYYINKYGYFDNNFFIFGAIKPLAPTTINRYKFYACEKSNIRPITLHQFRHSHATLLLSNGIMINEISKRLGHSKVSTTLDIYTHTDLIQEKRVINTLNSLHFDFFSIFKKQSFKSLTYILKHFSMF